MVQRLSGILLGHPGPHFQAHLWGSSVVSCVLNAAIWLSADRWQVLNSHNVKPTPLWDILPVILFLCCSPLLQCFSVPECLLWHDRCCLTDPQFGTRSIGFAYYSHRATKYFHIPDKMNCLPWLWKWKIFWKGNLNRICANEACDVFIVPWGLSGTLLLPASIQTKTQQRRQTNQPSTSQKHTSWEIKLYQNWNEVQHKCFSSSTSCIPMISATSID